MEERSEKLKKSPHKAWDNGAPAFMYLVTIFKRKTFTFKEDILYFPDLVSKPLIWAEEQTDLSI